MFYSYLLPMCSVLSQSKNREGFEILLRMLPQVLTHLRVAIRFRNALHEHDWNICWATRVSNSSTHRIPVNFFIYLFFCSNMNTLLTNYMPPKTITAVHIFPTHLLYGNNYRRTLHNPRRWYWYDCRLVALPLADLIGRK